MERFLGDPPTGYQPRTMLPYNSQVQGTLGKGAVVPSTQQYRLVSSPPILASAPSYQSSPSSTFGSSVFSKGKGPCSSASSSSSVPTANLNAQLEAGYEQGDQYPCLERYLPGCLQVFGVNEFELWLKHSLSHFGSKGPPKRSMCIFCDERFEGKDREQIWRERLMHIARQHFHLGELLESSRPDYLSIKRLYKNGQITKSEYEHACAGTERPKLEGLKPLGYIPREVKARREKEYRQANTVIVAGGSTRDRRATQYRI